MDPPVGDPSATASCLGEMLQLLVEADEDELVALLDDLHVMRVDGYVLVAPERDGDQLETTRQVELAEASADPRLGRMQLLDAVPRSDIEVVHHLGHREQVRHPRARLALRVDHPRRTDAPQDLAVEVV